MSPHRRTLLLSAAFEPIRIINPKKLFSMLMRDCIIVLDTYDESLRSARDSFQIPSVVALKRNYSYRRHVRCTRQNIYIRDGYRCMYCGVHVDELSEGMKGLTLDHVHPESRGGRNTFLNLVTACKSCNSYKGDCTPYEAGMSLLQEPHVPRPHPKYFCPVRKLDRAPEPWKAYLIA